MVSKKYYLYKNKFGEGFYLENEKIFKFVTTFIY
jgi:hypothetical protein